MIAPPVTAIASQLAGEQVSVGNAVHLLLHEATHIRDDSTDEARVECDTSKNAWSAVKLFHLAAWQDRQILRGMAVAHLDSVPSYLRDC